MLLLYLGVFLLLLLVPVIRSPNPIEETGGKVIMPKTEITDMGFIIVFLDTENNMFGLYQSIKKKTNILLFSYLFLYTL